MTDATHYWTQLEPTARALGRRIMQAPIGAQERKILALMVAGHFAGIACGALTQAQPDLADLPNHTVYARVSKELTELLRQQEIN